MGIDMTTITTKKTTAVENASLPSTCSPKETGSTTFKDEMKSVQETKKSNEEIETKRIIPGKNTTEVKGLEETTTNKNIDKIEKKEIDSKTDKHPETNATNNQEIKSPQETVELQNAQKLVQENNTQQILKDNLNKKNQTEENKNIEQEEVSDTLKELNSRITQLKGFKTDLNKQSINSKTDDKISTQSDYCQILKMDNNDIKFFVNLVENNPMTAQTAQINNQNIVNNNFTEIKSEATQKTVQISQALIDALNESVKTNKPFRIDFDKDIAVIMKVDKDGNLSANFIPGSAAVENYLRNNIEGLKQSFNQQNLPYNQLSYSRQQKREQNNNNKENKNE